MKRLHLLRHAHTLPGDPMAPDHTRRLSEQGRAECADVARRWREDPPGIERVLCSTAQRAVETYELLRGALPELPEASFQPKLYLASPEEIMKLLKNASEGAQTILVIGHNPGLFELAVSLADGEVAERLAGGLPTAGSVTVQSDAEFWKDIVGAENHAVRFERA